MRLAAELAFGADLAGDARHLRGKHVELLDHGIDDLGGAQEFALQRPAVDVELHGLQEVALRHRGDGARHLGGRPQQIVDQRIDASLHLAPGAIGQSEADTLAGAALAAHHLPDPFELLGHALVGGDDFIERVGDLAEDADPVARHADGKVADPHGLQRMKEFRQAAGIDRIDLGTELGIAVDVALGRRGGRKGGTVGCRASNVFSGLHNSLQS